MEEFKIPIGLSLALETIIEVENRVSDDREIPQYDLANINYIVIDLFTLTRDIVNSTPFEELTSDLILDKLKVAINYLKELPDLQGVLFFVNSYLSIFQKKERWRKHRDGSKAKYRKDLLFQVMPTLSHIDFGVPIYMNLGLNVPVNEMLIYTSHLHFILLQKQIYPDIYILESHTGKVLHNSEINKKYAKSAIYDRSKFPLSLYLLYIVGDNDYIDALPIGVLRAIKPELDKLTPNSSDSDIKKIIVENKLFDISEYR